MDRELTFRIVLEKPPAGVDFGLQKGRGSDYETIQKQRSQARDLFFQVIVGLKGGGKDAMPDFSGPFVQGSIGERFLYIDIGTYAGQKETSCSRRLKIPLTGVTWDMIDRMDSTRSVLEARIPGTGKDGGPNCATVKPFNGWNVVRSTGRRSPR